MMLQLPLYPTKKIPGYLAMFSSGVPNRLASHRANQIKTAKYIGNWLAG